ncbi:MAG: hypothetical protein KKH98_04065, partial [Spirochaetes bacterium]|nr:hypothetical protein [Spirochaetota bacterium]
MPGDKLIKIFTLCLLFCLIPFSSLFSEQEMNDEEFIKMVMERTFRFFWDEANPDNGLIPDATSNPDCSNSVTGFGLAAVCIAHKMGWITYKEAYDRVLKTLQNFADYPGNPSSIQVQKEHGHHYHWVDINSGQWIEQEGIWATDTAAFIAGVITVGEYFKGTEVQKTANMIYTNVDWTWFLNKNNNFFYVGWQPEEGFIYEYRMTKMGILPLIMAISSPTHPVPVETWYNLGNTYYHANYKGYNYVGDGAAYMHQWPLCFIDPRLKKDYFLDYFQDTREFSLASRQWCIDNKQDGYHENNWGLNPSVGPGDIYGEYAAPVIPGAPVPYNGKNNDGTVAPTAAISFMPFTPKESLAYMKYIYEKYKDEIFGKYGFTDSYNVKKDWWCKNFLGIDQGPIIIMLDNYLNGTVWKSFMANKYIRKGMQKIGFTGIIDDFDRTDHSPSYAKWLSLKDKYKFNKINTKSKEGEYSLKIKLTKIEKKDFFVIEPELKDLSGYKYLAFWQSGGFRPGILLVDSNKKRSSIKYIKKVMDGSWALYYYDISKLGIDTGSIHKIVVYLRSRYREDVYLDHIHLAHNMIDKLPPAPMNFKAETGKLRGEIKLSWNTPKPETQS